MATDPLRGIRVLDLTNVLAGPYCGYQLALMGAEVIKVERPGSGDLARSLGADPERNAVGMGISYLAQNAGKKSVTLNFKHPTGKELFKELVMTADVVVENFRPGVMDRLGLGAEALRAEDPELIYCAITGFGQTGPRRKDPAYDQIVQGVSGVMSITGDAGAAPLRVGYPAADTIGGLTAAFAIAAALNQRPRGATLDVSMTESVLATMGWVVSNYLIGGVVPTPQGNENFTSAPSGTFATADQPINIAANRDTQWESLASHLGLSHLIDAPEYRTREDRKRNRHALRAALEEVLTTQPAAYWVGSLNGLGVPTGPVLSVPEALADPQIAERGLVGEVPFGDEMLRITQSPVLQDGARPSVTAPPPVLGADNAEIWQSVGLSLSDIKALREEGVL